MTTPIYERAIQAVEDQFALAKEYGVDARTRVEELLGALSAINTSLHDIDIAGTVTFDPVTSTWTNFSGTPPTKPINTFTPGTKPISPGFSGITLGTEPPDLSGLGFTPLTINSAFTTYTSSLFNQLVSAIYTDIDRTSTETHKAERAQDRLLLKHNGMLDNVRAEWSQSNLPYPDGALAAAIESENKRYADEYSDLNRTIFIEESDIGVKIKLAAMSNSTQLESGLMEFSKVVYQRIFEASKTTAELWVRTHEIDLARYRIMTDIYRAISDVGIAEAKAIAEIYMSEVTAYKSEVEAEVSRIDSLVRFYLGEMEGYKVDLQNIERSNRNEIEELKAGIQLAIARADLELKKTDVSIRKYERENGINLEAQKMIGSVVAQEVAGILSSIQANASMSRQDSASVSYNYSGEIVGIND